ncbi:MAG TPA: choice-of-anchor J domain-containing protein, partial [Spirochaetota bacterium]|nr:choice-of-anchor J domain-containing protein [Spirochaetota bacterium]
MKLKYNITAALTVKILYIIIFLVNTSFSAVVFSEGFENGGSIPSGWSYEYVSGSFNWNFISGNQNSISNAYSGSYNAEFHVDAFNSDTTKLITPPINFNGFTSNTTLTFYHSQEDWTGDQDELHVYYRTNATAAWNLLQSYINPQLSWTQRTLSLPEANSSYYIAFEGVSGYGYGVTVDEVEITGLNPNPNAPLITLVKPNQHVADSNF